MVNKMQILPLDHFLLVMQKLAHFHGRWLTYRWMAEAGSLPQARPAHLDGQLVLGAELENSYSRAYISLFDKSLRDSVTI